MIAWSAVTAIAPELATVAPGVQAAILSIVGVMLPNSSALGDQYDTACTFLAAHLGTVDGGQGPSGPITSESVGGVARSYASLAPSDPAFGSTHYGRLFQSIVKNCAAARLVLL